jgi:hypothetical protein
MIYTSLCDQCVSQARLSPLSENSCSQTTCTFPETIVNLQQGQAGKRSPDARIQLWIAQQFQ